MNGHTSNQIFFFFYAIFLRCYAFAEVLASSRSDGSETTRRAALKLQLIWMVYFIHKVFPDMFRFMK